MSVAEIRRPDYIKDKIKRIGSFEDYMSSISNSTVRNYRRTIELYIDGLEASTEKKNNFRKILKEKLGNSEYEQISRSIENIMAQIEKSSQKSELLLTEEDYDFLLFVLTIKISNKDKVKITAKDIAIKQESGVGIVTIQMENDIKKYVLRQKNELFEKLFNTVRKQEQSKQVFKKNKLFFIVAKLFYAIRSRQKMRHQFIQEIYYDKVFIGNNLMIKQKPILDKGG